MNASVVDLCCGAGGFSVAFRAEGFDVKAGLDKDAGCREVYESNIGPFLERDIGNADIDEIASLFNPSGKRVLLACVPCQPFAAFGNTKEDHGLLTVFGRIVARVKPDAVAMENIPGLARHGNGATFGRFLAMLAESGYAVDHDVVQCSDYGAPQARRRLVLVASRKGVVELERPARERSDGTTVGEAIGHLPAIRAGEIHESDHVHRSSGLSPVNISRIRHSRPGGSWRDWPAHQMVRCHTTRSGKAYTSVYGRMEWSALAPTITTRCNNYGSGRFGHPEQDRAISMREAALLQTFPGDYDFGTRATGITTLARWIGNAVPVVLGRSVARSVAKSVDNFT